MSLYQFAMCYRDARNYEAKRVKERGDAISNNFSVIVPVDEENNISSDMKKLPEVVQIGSDKYMILRKNPVVVDMRKFPRDDEKHAREYSRMLMFCSWIREDAFLKGARLSEHTCEKMYANLRLAIEHVERGCKLLLLTSFGR